MHPVPPLELRDARADVQQPLVHLREERTERAAVLPVRAQSRARLRGRGRWCCRRRRRRVQVRRRGRGGGRVRRDG